MIEKHLLSRIDRVLTTLKKGRMVVVTDDAGRENEASISGHRYGLSGSGVSPGRSVSMPGYCSASRPHHKSRSGLPGGAFVGRM